jgi:hypothetical protein
MNYHILRLIVEIKKLKKINLQLGKNSVLEVEIWKSRLGVFGVKPKFGHDVSHCQCSKSCLNRYQNCLKLPKTTKICPKTIEVIIKY